MVIYHSRLFNLVLGLRSLVFGLVLELAPNENASLIIDDSKDPSPKAKDQSLNPRPETKAHS
jgi:hypothetical protein